MIRQKILELYAKTDKRLGVNKIKICLENEYCLFVSTGQMYRLMKEMNIPKMSTIKPPTFKLKTPENQTFENKLAQNFNVPAPNQVWVCDFTYVKVGQRFGYICVIMDLYARKVISYKISNHINTDSAIKTLQSAVKSRKISKGILFHTDRGSQFTAYDFRKLIDSLHIVQSFSAKVHPYDSAVIECFFKYLKKEELNRRSFSSIQQLNLSLVKYIDGFYNPIRPHSHNNGLSPNQMESLFFN
ncbi:MAG TPA: IS3 family transposase [Candidatus Butyricicoccus avistercoris]|uniref:IS3 family transposase n=1 Tax=Candidatus Butyricicoccus avistercoris TaxID=2838518 RepID=A0A9D1PH25_9FIRM|nr:IS3 family transposase [Candidatus Butyricicoccus avistercoris]